MNYPPGVTGREPYFDPPDEPDPLGDCGGCDKLVIQGEDWVDRGGVLWHEDCLPDDDGDYCAPDDGRSAADGPQADYEAAMAENRAIRSNEHF